MKAISLLLKNCCYLLALVSFFSYSAQAADNGKDIFKGKCAACHSAGKDKMVGPGLKGINEKYDKEWLHSWIKDSQAMVKAGDEKAIAIFEEYNKIPMQAFPDLSDEDIDAILDYIEKSNAPAPAAAEAPPAPVDEIHGHAKAQVDEWRELSRGTTAETLVPLIIFSVFMGLVLLSMQKVPNLRN